jgi:hypothetical protein
MPMPINSEENESSRTADNGCEFSPIGALVVEVRCDRDCGAIKPSEVPNRHSSEQAGRTSCDILVRRCIAARARRSPG